MNTVVDLHCDLLGYLCSNPAHTPFDEKSKTSLLQLKAGNVKTQAFAIFTETGETSVQEGLLQAALFHKIEQEKEKAGGMRPLLAVENSSSFFNEDEPLEKGFQRLEKVITTTAKPLYMSLTWKTENRFGGGDTTKIGLKEDGKKLLEWMEAQKIAVDFSHTSDFLAYDILRVIDQEKLKIRVLASHSNFRSKMNNARNLPDDLAHEIVKRRGIIGMNLVYSFIGPTIDSFVEHINFAIESGYEEHLALGADFFYEDLMPKKWKMSRSFFDDFSDSSCYPRLFELISQKIEREKVEKLFSKNALRFIQEVYLS